MPDMSSTSSSTPEVSPLGVLGFTAGEERLYRLLLRHSGSTMTELAGLVGQPIGELREQVTRFAGVGILEVQDEGVVATPPQESLGRLINEEAHRVRSRGEQLDAVRVLLPSLQADHLASTAPTREPVTGEG